MASDLWIAKSDTVDKVKDLIRKHHHNLIFVEDEIQVLFKEKAGKRGGQVVLGAVSKASKKMKVVAQTDIQFIFELAADQWRLLDEDQQIALLDHLLCHCHLEEDEKSGEMKYSLKSPDLCFFTAELERHGNWRPREEELSEEQQQIEMDEMLLGN